MTVTGIQVSPLRAAREWRGISLVSAARTSGLGVARTEALEDGSSETFASVEEMVAAAVLYGASLGIGRDEAMALLDRTISAGGASAVAHDAVEVSTTQGSTHDFSAAVRAKSEQKAMAAAIVRSDSELSLSTIEAPMVEISPEETDTAQPVGVIETSELTGEIAIKSHIPDRVDGAAQMPPSVRAALELDPQYRAAWESASSELESWAEEHEGVRGAKPLLAYRVKPFLTKLVGEQRADWTVTRLRRAEIATRASARSFREWLRKSQHATLIVAVGVGIVLIALLISVASVFDGGSATQKKSNGPALVTPGSTSTATSKQNTKPEKKPVVVAKKPVPMLPASKVHLQILNAGPRAGYAKQIGAGLQARGYKIDAVGNSKTGYGSSVILYPPSLRREAARLSRQTSVTTMDTLPATGARKSIILVVM